jgi:hypothetical protein
MRIVVQYERCYTAIIHTRRYMKYTFHSFFSSMIC